MAHQRTQPGRMLRRLGALLAFVLLAACAPTPPAPPAPPVAATVVPTTPPIVRSGGGQPPSDDASGSAVVDLYAQSAPEFPPDAEWLNIDRPLTMAGLRGKLVLIDFWTYGCVNCLHNLPELKRLQEEHPDELVVIGVHSAKFSGEAETDNIRRVIQRYELSYPIVNDKKLTVWHTWNVRAWPTLVLVDTAGVMATIHVGDGAYRAIKPLVVALIKEADGRGRLDRTPLAATLAREARPATLLAFPGKVLADPRGGRLFIADSGHHRVVVVDAGIAAKPVGSEGRETERSRASDPTGVSTSILAVIGSGARGLADGDFASAAFDTPQGMALSADGRTLYVADTGNHAIRAVDLQGGTVATIAGSGERALAPPQAPRAAREAALSSPWDLALDGTDLYIAMAGLHQIWRLDLLAGTVGPFAGSSREGVADGPPSEAELAQPSGLALDGAGQLYFADSESSSIRRVALGQGGAVETVAGGGRTLFAFGDADGQGRDAKLQHPLGVAFADGAIFLVDSYNHKIKRLDPASGAVRTLFGGERGWRDGGQPLFYEPGGITAANGRLYIADTNNHAIRVIDLANGMASTLVLTGIERFQPDADAPTYRGAVIRLDPTVVAPGAGSIRLDLALPPGYKVNALAPSSLAWQVEGSVATLPPDADRTEAGLSFPVELAATFQPGAGAIIADLTVIYCEAETPDICLIEEARLIAPLTVADGGISTLTLRHQIRLPGDDGQN